MWKNLIGTIAPTIGVALGGPLGGLASSLLCNALGIDSTKEKDLEVILNKPTHEQVLAVKKAEQDFLIRLQELEITKEQLVFQDRDSARNREIKTGDSWTPRILAAIAVLGFFVLVGLIFTVPMDSLSAQQGALIGTCLGYSVSLAKDAYSFYFGSSKGSEEKNSLLWNSTPKTN